MQQIRDEGLILTVQPMGEHDALVTVLMREHGLYRGIVKRALTSRNRADIQPATLVDAEWKARLAEHLGTLTLEARYGFAARVMASPLKLAAVGSLLGMLAVTLAEHDPHAQLYSEVCQFLQRMVVDDEALPWLTEYVRLELRLLEQLGFGLDLSACASTGTVEDLCYVSPKSGRAVSGSAGAPYHARMLPLPAFLLHEEAIAADGDAIHAGVRLSGYFMEQHAFPTLHRHVPVLRTHFVQLLTRHLLVA